jgi:SAM-dependent methyltransferase
VTADFDDHSVTYGSEVSASVSFTGQDVEFYARCKAERLLSLIIRHLGDPSQQTVLDVGCGPGVTDAYLVEHVGSLIGVDRSASILEQAVARNPGVAYRHDDGTDLGVEPGSIDVAFAVCVVHHVPKPERPAFARQLARAVRPGGLVAIFEHNPLNPLTRVAVSRCEFDEGVDLLRAGEVSRHLSGAGLEVLERRYLQFTPLDKPWARRLDVRLGRVPIGAQHYVLARRAG